MFQVRPFVKMDFDCVQAIYQQGIDTGLATFQTNVKSWPEWDESFLHNCRLVVLNESNRVCGWAALSPVSSRCCYSGVAEVTVYMANDARGYGGGEILLKALVACSEKHGIWTLKAGVFEQNKASIRLHQKCGFRLLGIQEGLGKLGNQWINIAAMERRSTVVGID